MASPRHLKDLLEEDQEPFQLQSYISDRRRQITHLQVKKRRPVSQNAGLPSRFCRNACFFSLRESPDPKKSPLFEPKSPIRSQNAIFVNIPARTASMLLEAAVRIQKQSTEGSRKKTRNVGNAFGVFGSMLKKLTHRKKREISGGKDGGGVSSGKDMLRWETPVVRKIVTKRNGEEQSSSQTQKTASETQFSRRSSSSGVWSESVTNGERSWDCDFEPSISSSSGSDGLDGLACGLTNGSDLSDDTRFCESPFRFVLQTTLPSPGGFRTPNFTSPAASPRHHCPEMKKESYEVEKLKKLEIEEEEEEDKEQSSPVSVLDPPFEDDDEDIHMDDKNITSSFRSVQKAKNLLLQKLCRFEQLAGLDPLEFEKSMSDQETEEDMEEEEEEMRNHYQCEMITQRVLKTYFEDMTEVPEGIEALISDLVAKELQNNSLLHDGEAQVTKRVCERLRSWRDVESNTIDMMVEHDFRTESLGSWRSKNDAEVSEAVVEIEFEIFENLVEDLSQDIGGYW